MKCVSLCNLKRDNTSNQILSSNFKTDSVLMVIISRIFRLNASINISSTKKNTGKNKSQRATRTRISRKVKITLKEKKKGDRLFDC